MRTKKVRALVLLCVGACTTYSGVELSGDGTRIDGGVDANTAGDATTAGDTATAGDAPGNDGATAEAGSACDATLCENFDDMDLPGRFDGVNASNGTVKRDETFSVSGRRSARFVSTMAPVEATLRKDLPTLTRVECEFELRLNSSGTPGSSALVFYLNLYAEGVTSYGFFFVVSGNNTSLERSLELSDGGISYLGKTDIAPLPLNKWTHVVLRVEPTNNRYVLAIDPNNVVIAAPNPGLITGGVLRLGIYNAGGVSDGVDLSIDDVRCSY